MMDGGKKKRKKNLSANPEIGDLEDRISSLSDPLICHILSFLKMKHVIKTSLLARRWRSLWTTVPVLDFESSWTDNSSIATLIAHSFIRYEGVKIRKFRAIADKGVKYCEIDSWLHFTTKRGIEELVILYYFDSIISNRSISDNYRMPRFLDYGSLRVLKLEYCALDLRASDCFPSLRELHLSIVHFTDMDTSGCPLLEELIIKYCSNCRNIFAPNEKLRFFKEQSGRCNGLTIYAPYLLSIEFQGHMRQFYNFKNVSSLKSAFLGFLFGTGPGDEHHTKSGEVMLVLIKELGHAKTLKLSKHAIQILGGDNVLKMPSLNASSLEVDISFGNKTGIIMITSLLNRTPRLENFIIRNESETFPRDYVDDTCRKSLALALHHLQLRTVTIHGILESLWYSGLSEDELMENLEKGEMKLIKLLLKGCRVLDKMVIRASEMSWPSHLGRRLQKNAKAKKRFSNFQLALVSKLLLLPRASESARVEFSWNM